MRLDWRAVGIVAGAGAFVALGLLRLLPWQVLSGIALAGISAVAC